MTRIKSKCVGSLQSNARVILTLCATNKVDVSGASWACHAFLRTRGGTRDKRKNVCVGG